MIAARPRAKITTGSAFLGSLITVLWGTPTA
jgi:hypothetical protein